VADKVEPAYWSRDLADLPCTCFCLARAAEQAEREAVYEKEMQQKDAAVSDDVAGVHSVCIKSYCSHACPLE
jgi:hypothetical protein